MLSSKQPIRSLVSLLVTWSFLILTLSGIVLYVVPQGRVAYWIHWSLGGLEKDQWGAVHMVFGGVFILSGIAHLYFNWKPFKAFLVGKVKGHFALKREVVIVSAVTVALFATTVLNIPPASWVTALNDSVKSSWISSPDLEPPFGHAEGVSLAGLARKLHLDLDAAISELRQQGFFGIEASATLEEIARANDTVPMQVYAIMREHETKPSAPIGGMTIEELEAEYAGTGLGRKALSELCEIADIDLISCRKRLSDAGIDSDLGEQTKKVAEKHDRKPVEILAILLAR